MMGNFEICPFCKSKTMPHNDGGVSSCSNVNCYIYGIWIPVAEWPEDHRIELLQYKSLRVNFNKMVSDVMGPNYCTMANDVYGSDAECCDDVTRKAKKNWFERLVGW